MVYNLLELESLPHPHYDVCIIGSGPAGCSIANMLSDSGKKVCVLESGGLKFDSFADSLRDLDSHGILIKSYSRERVVGGTSLTWAGLSAPLDPIDFFKRDWVKYSGWPITQDELLPYYKEASKIFRFPSIEMFQDKSWMDFDRNEGNSPVWNDIQEKIFVAPENPQNWGEEFAGVFKSDNIDLFYNATVTHLDGSPDSGDASEAVVSSVSGKEFRISADVFVLACGGIENPRLLLNTLYACRDGLGNDKDQVGRYFMNHPKNNYGTVQLRQPIGNLPGYIGFLSLKSGYAAYLGLRIHEQIQNEQQLLNSYVRFEPVFNWSGRESIQSLVYLVKHSGLMTRTFKSMKKDKVLVLRDYSETGDDSDLLNDRKHTQDILKMIGKIMLDFPTVAKYVYNRIFDGNSTRITSIQLRNFMEMEPRPENRVMLGSKMDYFGKRIPYVVHNLSELDKRSLSVLHNILINEMQRLGLGSVSSRLVTELEPWPVKYDASHHMGATRMGNDPATSVVDTNCRLHYCRNVYMAGASVFPTSGIANPTFTIVALAIRLAKHLKTEKYKE